MRFSPASHSLILLNEIFKDLKYALTTALPAVPTLRLVHRRRTPGSAGDRRLRLQTLSGERDLMAAAVSVTPWAGRVQLQVTPVTAASRPCRWVLGYLGCPEHRKGLQALIAGPQFFLAPTVAVCGAAQPIAPSSGQISTHSSPSCRTNGPSAGLCLVFLYSCPLFSMLPWKSGNRGKSGTHTFLITIGSKCPAVIVSSSEVFTHCSKCYSVIF